MAKLYEIVAELRDFAETMEGMEEEQVYKDTLEGLQGELDDKVEQWCKCLKNIEGERDAVKAEKERLDARQKALENKASHMKDTLLQYLKAAGVTKAGHTIGAKIVKNGGQAPLEVLTAPEDLPAEFQTVKIEANKAAIREALEAGQVVAGARICERGEHLKIG